MEYNPNAFKIQDEVKSLNIAKSISFASIIYVRNGRVEVSQSPVYVDVENKTIVGHFALNNPAAQVINEQEVLLTFQGGHGVIKPEWYGTENNVPTWNYVTVHLRGKANIFTDHKLLNQMLLKMAELYSIKDLKMPDRLLNGITGFQIDISEVHGKAKLGQTKPAVETENVIRELLKVGNTELANLMKQTLG